MSSNFVLAISHILAILAGFGIGWFVKNPRSQALAVAATQAAEAVAEQIKPGVTGTQPPTTN
jgi:hypothetical protein